VGSGPEVMADHFWFFLLWFVCASATSFFCYGFGVLVLLAAGSAVIAGQCWFFYYGLSVPWLGLPLGSI